MSLQFNNLSKEVKKTLPENYEDEYFLIVVEK